MGTMKDLKTKRLAVRVTDEEYKWLKVQSKSKEMRLSTYLRSVILKGKK